MYVVIDIDKEKRSVGRPRREDSTERANLKLNSAIRKLLKNSAILDGRSESAQVERLIIENEALKRLLREDTELASNLLPKFNQKINDVLIELSDNV